MRMLTTIPPRPFSASIYATLKFQPIREKEKRSHDKFYASDRLKFERKVRYAENGVYRIGPWTSRDMSKK